MPYSKATVIADAQAYQVLRIELGRSRADIRPFFEELGDYTANIEAVAMAINTAFDLEIQSHCPNARIPFGIYGGNK